MDTGHGTRTLDEDIGIQARSERLGEERVEPVSEMRQTLFEESGREERMLSDEYHQSTWISPDVAEADTVGLDPGAVLGMRGDRDSARVVSTSRGQ